MYKKVMQDVLPKRERTSKSAFEATPEWRRMRADIARGLKHNESCVLQFSQKDWDRVGLSGKKLAGRQVAAGCYAIQRFIKRYTRTTGRKYVVRVLHNGGFDYTIVDGPS